MSDNVLQLHKREIDPAVQASAKQLLEDVKAGKIKGFILRSVYESTEGADMTEVVGDVGSLDTVIGHFYRMMHLTVKTGAWWEPGPEVKSDE